MYDYDLLTRTSWFNLFIQIVPVTKIVSGKSCGVNFDQSRVIYSYQHWGYMYS